MLNSSKKSLTILQNIRQKGFFHLLSANLLIQVVAFFSQLFVAGILSPDDIGRIKVIQTFLSIFSVVAGMGFSSSTLKLCSENRSTEDQTALFRSALFFTILSTVSMYIIILILNLFGIFSSDKLIQWLIPLGLFPIITNTLFIVFISYFQAIKKIKLLSKLTISNKLISIIGIILLSYFWGIKGYYVAYNISFLFILLICFQVLSSVFSKQFFSRTNFSQFSTHWYYAKPSMMSYLLSETSAYVDILLISYFVKDMHQIGYYSFALTITVIFRLFPSTVQQITIPFFSLLADKKTDFIIAFKRYNRILYGVVAITLIVALILVPPMIHLIFKGKYDMSMPYFPLLAIGWSLRQLAQLQNGAIFGLGKIHYNVKVSLITLVFSVVAIGISLYYFGLIGAAYASIAGGLVHLISSSYYYQKAQREML